MALQRGGRRWSLISSWHTQHSTGGDKQEVLHVHTHKHGQVVCVCVCMCACVRACMGVGVHMHNTNATVESKFEGGAMVKYRDEIEVVK